MKKLKKLFENELLILLLNAVVMHTVFVAVVLSVYQGAPEVLADSGYRHELESDIEPFKGLLLGIFFISIGASLNFSLIYEKGSGDRYSGT